MFPTSARILIVDDMDAMRKVLGKALREMGFTDITEAADGVLAWSAISGTKSRFHLIISDWNMPNCMGIDLLRRLRADSRYKKTPFIMVTAESEQQQIVEAVRAGVDQYIVKPFNTEILRQKIETVYKKYSK